MKFARIGPVGQEMPVVIQNQKFYDISDLTRDIDPSFIESGFGEAQQRLQEGTLKELRVTNDMRVGSPITRPGSIICVGMNYVAHAAESGSEPPEHMVIFNKLSNTIAGPNDDVIIPPNSSKMDWEVELGVVIGKTSSYLTSRAEASENIAGYTLVNDLSERAWQLELSGGQWGKGKSGPGFTPCGPWLVPQDQFNPSNARLRSWVNGEARQDSNTSDMIFDVPHIVWELSQYMILEPGDLILTGTPEGVALSGRFPYLKPQDLVELEIEGLGKQSQRLLSHIGGNDEL